MGGEADKLQKRGEYRRRQGCKSGRRRDVEEMR
jgi:hypothetical protein